MAISRRGFLKGMLGLGATALTAPAICKAENLMKIFVPDIKILISTPSYLQRFGDDYDGDVINHHLVMGRTEVYSQSVLAMKHRGGELENYLSKEMRVIANRNPSLEMNHYGRAQFVAPSQADRRLFFNALEIEARRS